MELNILKRCDVFIKMVYSFAASLFYKRIDNIRRKIIIMIFCFIIIVRIIYSKIIKRYIIVGNVYKLQSHTMNMYNHLVNKKLYTLIYNDKITKPYIGNDGYFIDKTLDLPIYMTTNFILSTDTIIVTEEQSYMKFFSWYINKNIVSFSIYNDNTKIFDIVKEGCIFREICYQDIYTTNYLSYFPDICNNQIIYCTPFCNNIKKLSISFNPERTNTILS